MPLDENINWVHDCYYKNITDDGGTQIDNSKLWLNVNGAPRIEQPVESLPQPRQSICRNRVLLNLPETTNYLTTVHPTKTLS